MRENSGIINMSSNEVSENTNNSPSPTHHVVSEYNLLPYKMPYHYENIIVLFIINRYIILV